MKFLAQAVQELWQRVWKPELEIKCKFFSILWPILHHKPNMKVLCRSVREILTKDETGNGNTKNFPRLERLHTGYPHTKNEVSRSSGSRVMTKSLKTGSINKMQIFIHSVADTPPTNQIWRFYVDQFARYWQKTKPEMEIPKIFPG